MTRGGVGDNIGIASIIGLHRVVEVRPVGLCMRAPRLAALVTATSFGTIIGLASSNLPSQDWLDEVRAWRALDNLAKLASSFIALRRKVIAATFIFAIAPLLAGPRLP
jgi:hypothetical protein